LGLAVEIWLIPFVIMKIQIYVQYSIISQLSFCDGAGAEGRFELRPPVESSDLDEKVLLWVEVYVASVTICGNIQIIKYLFSRNMYVHVGFLV
jgi:hypothetical protein